LARGVVAAYSAGNAYCPKKDAMDIRRLTRGEILAGAAGIALTVISVIPQWGSATLDGVRINGFESSFSLWEAGLFGILPKLAAFLGVAAVVLVLIQATGATLSVPTVTYLALGLAATLLMLMGVAVGPSIQGGRLGGIEMTRGPLLYAAAVLCAVILFGGWLHLRGEDTDFDNRSAAPPPM
jgi:hypothetical protein